MCARFRLFAPTLAGAAERLEGLVTDVDDATEANLKDVLR